VHSSASVPIRLRGKVIAALMVYAAEPDFFDADIVATLEEIAGEVQFGLEALATRKELEESRNLLQSVIDASAAPVYAYDREGRCLLMNEACARIVGCPRDAVIGRTRDEFMSPADVARNRADDERVLQEGAPIVAEETVGEGPGRRTFLSVKYPLRDLGGAIYAVGAVSTEITELRRAQQEVSDANLRLEETVAVRTRELITARDRAEQADRAKTAFLSTVSHELRTPLNSMIGFTDVVLQELAGPLNDEQKRQLAIVQESSRMLLGLINEMLDLSRIEAGRLQLALAPFDLAELLRRQVAAFAPLAAQKSLVLEQDIDPGLAGMTSDAQRVAQIVANLLSNATKFTWRGGISLRARRDGAAATIEIRDTGPGITREDLALLFKPFVQVGDARRTHREGTGLGLVISRHLARALGGDIEVESEPGKGTRFIVTLPMQAPTVAPAPGDAGPSRTLATPA
jgi:PAS domain S-box-containing protein